MLYKVKLDSYILDTSNSKTIKNVAKITKHQNLKEVGIIMVFKKWTLILAILNAFINNLMIRPIKVYFLETSFSVTKPISKFGSRGIPSLKLCLGQNDC